MAKPKKLLERMQANPQGDWTVANVKTVCKQERLELRHPSSGSHYVVSSPHLRDSLTVPHARPLKAHYIRELVGFVLAHRYHSTGKEARDE